MVGNGKNRRGAFKAPPPPDRIGLKNAILW